MSWFLYESRLPNDDVGSCGLDVQFSPPALVNVDSVAGSDGSQLPSDVATSTEGDCIVLTAVSAPAQSPPDSDVQIVDSAVASPLHAAARQRRQSYEQNRHWQDS
jgi:hypothetical protein